MMEDENEQDIIEPEEPEEDLSDDAEEEEAF